MWNSLIFQLYKDRISINVEEIEEQLKNIQKCDLSGQGQITRLGAGNRSAHLDSACAWTRAPLSSVQLSIARLMLPGCSAQGFLWPSVGEPLCSQMC